MSCISSSDAIAEKTNENYPAGQHGGESLQKRLLHVTTECLLDGIGCLSHLSLSFYSHNTTQHNTFQSSPTPSDSVLSSHFTARAVSLCVHLLTLSISLSLSFKPESDLCRIQTAITLMFCVNMHCLRFPCLSSY